ncbi:MAG TPA: ATP-dependent helicase, partial [Rhodanobacteraceae bacterium]|nr:ATP-dependent helicase [Rhodanobacteraceae bacterium]
MPTRNASTQTAPDASPQAPDKSGALPAAWRRLLSEPKRRTPSGSVLGFLLELVNDAPPVARVEVAPVLLEPVPGGRLGRAVPLDPRQLTQAGLPGPMLRLAAGVLGLPQTQRKGRSYAHLSGEFGDALLTEMLEGAPCLLGGVAGLRLTRGKPRALSWHWQMEADGRQRLLPELSQSERLLRIGGLWYLAAERAELGQFEQSIDEVNWLDAPPLSPEYGDALAQAIQSSPYEKRIPAPRAFAAVERAELAPKPVLTLHALTRHARIGAGTPPLAYARLAFDYGGEKLPGRGGEPLVRRVRDGKLVEIARKRADELATMERLEGFGLAPAVDCEGLPWDMADALPEDAWLFPGKGYAGALEVNTPARWLSLREKLETDGFNVDYASTFPFEVLEGPPQWYGVA